MNQQVVLLKLQNPISQNVCYYHISLIIYIKLYELLLIYKYIINVLLKAVQ